MKIVYKNKRIKTYSCGFILQTKVGKQYKESKYLTTLEAAINHLFDDLVNEINSTVNLNESDAWSQVNEIAKIIQNSKDELRMVLQHA